jgi:hypothetical protein
MSNSQGSTVMAVGRIVWLSGDLFAGKLKTIFGTNTPKLNAQGEQMKEYGFGLAISKADLQQTGEGEKGHIWAVVNAEAQGLYPQGLPPGFAMKFKDGDGIDHNGQPLANRAGHAGHMIFSCTTSLPIKFFKFENGANVMINEGIKCGDYVNVQLQVKAHGPVGQGKPGLYLNPNAVQLVGYGEAIINTPSGDQLFGTAQPGMPAGASATPVAAPGQLVAAPMTAHQGAFGGPELAQAPAPVQQAPAPAATPNYGILPTAQQPVQQAPVMQQPVQQAPAMQGAAPVPGFPVI